MNDKVCLVTGVGEGTGAAIARRFASDGYRVAMLARNEERLAILEKELNGSRAFAFDLADLDRLIEVCQWVKENMGVPEVVVHNAVRATFDTFAEGDPEDLERNFRVNTTSLLFAFGVVPDERRPAESEHEEGAARPDPVQFHAANWRAEPFEHDVGFSIELKENTVSWYVSAHPGQEIEFPILAVRPGLPPVRIQQDESAAPNSSPPEGVSDLEPDSEPADSKGVQPSDKEPERAQRPEPSNLGTDLSEEDELGTRRQYLSLTDGRRAEVTARFVYLWIERDLFGVEPARALIAANPTTQNLLDQACQLNESGGGASVAEVFESLMPAISGALVRQ